ncbi:hypothetical protein ACFQJ6_10490 [Halorussus caseinilyticus]|uniref:Uncharacterized protein n=1 Tax=Halorussus caseinilyticus TaxID=3034025 RepID=A0ABD5WP92_9EURY|nr:hypothetical protein [Halorussus sp. DT72]
MVAIGPPHGGTGMNLPLAADTASLILAVGAVVFGLVVYDAYRTYWG